MNDSRVANGQSNGHASKTAEDENDHDDSDDDKEDEGGAGDPGATGGKVILKS